MLGFFRMLGRSHEARRFDEALNAAGLNPGYVPESVKLTTLKQLKEAKGGSTPDLQTCAGAAELLGYCLLGSNAFIEANGARRTDAVEARLEAALEAGYGLDARLVLLTLHAGLINSAVVERYRLTAE